MEHDYPCGGIFFPDRKLKGSFIGIMSGARPIKILSGAFKNVYIKGMFSLKSQREKRIFMCNYIHKSFPTYGKISDAN